MPVGKIKRLVHLSAQSSRLQNTSLLPTRNFAGYGYIDSGGEELYFDADAADCEFELLAVGQDVEYARDPNFPMAGSVRPATSPAARASTTASPPAVPQSTAAAAEKKPPRPKKPAEELPTLVLSDKRQCILVARYHKVEEHLWRRVRKEPEIETYTEPVADRFNEPAIELVSGTRCAVRIYDEQAVDLKRAMDFLGDYRAALARCDEALLARFPGERIADLSPLQS